MQDNGMNIAVCYNRNGWHEKFMSALSSYTDSKITYALVDISSDDWIMKLHRFNAVLWKPDHMGVESASYFKEKIFFIQNHLRKTVFPNYDTIWHFESKVAQKYLFEHYGICTPHTVTTFCYKDALAMIKESAFPLVFKKSAGAASTNVRLVKTSVKAMAILNRVFCSQVVAENWAKKGRLLSKLSMSYLRLWINWKTSAPNQPVAYWQEFIPGNTADLRITVIGSKYAFGFWRKNRKNDFRASGSGHIDYDSTVPEEVIRYCISINKRLNFDSMAYDVLFTNNSYKIIEMSYGYVDSAIYHSKGYYEMEGDNITFTGGHFWPQELWVKTLVERSRN